jgi:phosphatidylserine/phosphatidylglycerophosphate/cardiolipin synthase-like enzyme
MESDTGSSDTGICLVTDREIYEKVTIGLVPQAQDFCWLATADLKDLYVHNDQRTGMQPFLGLLSALVERGVSIRLLHAKEPGPVFRKEFDRYPALIDGMERMLCPRVHFKTVIVDGQAAYIGSANLTGAGMGAKGPDKRNFENGIITSDPSLVGAVMEQFDHIWMGARCTSCRRKAYCPDYRDMLEE